MNTLLVFGGRAAARFGAYKLSQIPAIGNHSGPFAGWIFSGPLSYNQPRREAGMARRKVNEVQLSPEEMKLARRAERAVRRLQRIPWDPWRERSNGRGEPFVSLGPVDDYFLEHPEEARAFTKLRRLQLEARRQAEAAKSRRRAMATRKPITDQLTPEELKLARRAERAIRQLERVPWDPGQVQTNERGDLMVSLGPVFTYIVEHPEVARAFMRLRKLQLEDRQQMEVRQRGVKL
jgi:hypothetical protein